MQFDRENDTAPHDCNDFSYWFTLAGHIIFEISRVNLNDLVLIPYSCKRREYELVDGIDSNFK